MKVSTVDEMRAMDRKAFEHYGIPEVLLMENAGLAAFEAIRREFAVKGTRFLVVAGVGNNGGDGFVVARRIVSEGGAASVLIVGDKGRCRGAALTNLEILERLKVPLAVCAASDDASGAVAGCDVVVDALFGTGLARPLEGLHMEAVRSMNMGSRPVVSLDIPSGINGDTGAVMGCAVRAGITVAFGLPKPGNLLMPGSAHCGRLLVSHISFPPALYEDESVGISVNEPPPPPPRDPSGHKGDFGEALFIAGAGGYYGAPGLAALSFLKAGGGYSRLAAPESVIPFIAAFCPEVVFHPMAETASFSLSAKNKTRLLELSERADFVVMGPGVSLDDETSALVRELAGRIAKPLLVDGDGITALCTDLSCIARRGFPTVLTPHPGEMSRLTGRTVACIEQDRIPVLREACRALNASIVLKGAHSLIGHPDGRVIVNLSGNPGMATAGSGDVLTGAAAAMSGLGLGVQEALEAGVFIHGAAGDLASSAKGPDGITARDIMEALPEAVRLHREGSLARRYLPEVI
jgi:NAD(P)H-hydrate epimerase